MAMKLSGIAEQIWNDKYRFKGNDGQPIDKTVEDTFTRVARGLASVEDKEEYWAREFYDAMANFEVIPAGRILAGAGTGRSVTLMNCYVMDTVPDSLSGIMDVLKRSALTMKQGGGIGTDFSTLRPSGSLITSLGSTSSGPLSFMDQWDAMCRSIMSAGHRRGAMMGTLRVDHPDVEAFIDAKKDPKRFRMFNLSVLVTDSFMQAVKDDTDWHLQFKGTIYKTVRARELWDKIMRNTYDMADPGVIFIDRVNAWNPLNYAEMINCTNPCGEQCLPPNGACDLGSLNLARLVLNPFTDQAQFDWERIGQLVPVLTRMLDNVLDVTGYPLEEQRAEAMSKRRIGIGITGFADALAMLGVKYSDGDDVADLVLSEISRLAASASYDLGKEKGNFPLLDTKEYGVKYRRNSHVMSIAPTGTISLFAGNVSSGIEPIFDLMLKRRILQKDDTWQTVEIADYAWDLCRNMPEAMADKKWACDVWETAATITPQDHLKILAACQKHVDSSVSKTINCPESISFEDFKEIYTSAYSMGCKSCTTYRPNAITGSILQSDSMEAKKEKKELVPISDNVVAIAKPLARPEKLTGATYKLKPAEHALYITITDIEDNGRLRPFEIFINTKNLEYLVWTTALTRMISAVFRKGGDVSFIVEELQAVHDPRGGYWSNQGYVPSIIAGIGGIISEHLSMLGMQGQQPVDGVTARLHCPQCQTGALEKREGCWSCTSCSYSKCG